MKIKRLSLIMMVVILHGGIYYSVNLINGMRSAFAFYDFNTFVDDLIPFMGWTWIFYYFGDVYITLFAAAVALRLSDRKFNRVLYTYSGMIITGAIIQILFPAEAPWPDKLASAQEFVHNLISERPYACLPSMHVALAVLPACLLYSVSRSVWIRIISTLAAIFITISTLTLKEHFFLDTVTGVMFGLFFYGIWHLSLRNDVKEIEGDIDGDTKRKIIQVPMVKERQSGRLD